MWLWHCCCWCSSLFGLCSVPWKTFHLSALDFQFHCIWLNGVHLSNNRITAPAPAYSPSRKKLCLRILCWVCVCVPLIRAFLANCFFFLPFLTFFCVQTFFTKQKPLTRKLSPVFIRSNVAHQLPDREKKRVHCANCAPRKSGYLVHKNRK